MGKLVAVGVAVGGSRLLVGFAVEVAVAVDVEVGCLVGDDTLLGVCVAVVGTANAVDVGSGTVGVASDIVVVAGGTIGMASGAVG